MKITIIVVGKLKEAYLRDGVKKYSKDISKNHVLEIIELADEKTEDGISESEILKIKDIEGKRILKRIPDYSYVVALAIEGKEVVTNEFARLINAKGYRDGGITFIIGGSLGLSNQVIKKAESKISFSKMTFPHQLMRLVLLEQIECVMKD